MEFLQLVDKEGYPTGQADREACHGNPQLMHLVVHLHVFDREGRLLLQKRASTKDTYPGLWDTSVGGHVRAGELVPDALRREAREELGIEIDPWEAQFLYSVINSDSFETESARCFASTIAGTLTPDSTEVEEVRFFSMEEIEALKERGSLTPSFQHELPLLRRYLEAPR
ncbi:MAG TPA: NUDIX domain-containing protein [Spirochaetia bacterium]|nr:NUDIX domain-containing protein [Spirochaetia bacterium]